MPSTRYSDKELRRELDEFRDHYPRLHDDDLFILWFLRAFVVESENAALEALCGGSRDKGVDAILIDERTHIVFVIQGKYHQKAGVTNERRGDVIGFAQLALNLCGNGDLFASLSENMSPEVLDRLKKARNRITKRRYSTQMYYVTTGKCSNALCREADRIVRAADAQVSFHVFDSKRVLLLLTDYLDGVAPPVPSLDLDIEAGSGVRTSGVFNRFDRKTDIESWVFSMTDVAVAGLYERAGPRLFARNVRGFLGSTEINRGMEATLADEPEFFWYYNNGVTIICDEAKQESSRGQHKLRVTNPQVINGQQTTRALARTIRRGQKASVLVRVIRVPREVGKNTDHFETLVSKIVSATNWQNAIRPSDLMSNDRRQIEIERHLRKLGYFYLRKRMTKGEARQLAGVRNLHIVKKEEFAQAVAGCDLDPAIVREGRELLFEERLYSQIFPKSDPNYYLSRYWLLRRVSYAARGSRERVYAKWLVLNFVWPFLDPLCRSRGRADAFRRACERGDDYVLDPLNRPIDIAFKAVLRFYRSNRGKGRDRIDAVTFFKRHNLHKEFEKYWKAAENRSRPAFDKAWARFQKAIEKDMVG